MTTDYAANAKALDKRVSGLFKAAPEAMKAFRALHETSNSDGAIEAKTKELMALAIAVAIRCEGCITHHARAAVKKGAGRDEVAETIGVAIQMAGGPATDYGAAALEAFDQFAGE